MVVSPEVLEFFELLSDPEQLIKKKTKIKQTRIFIFAILPVIFSPKQACDSCLNDRNLLFERKYMPVLQQVVNVKLARHLVPAATDYGQQSIGARFITNFRAGYFVLDLSLQCLSGSDKSWRWK